ncbi:MAG: UDP-N-acetylmuramate dehydrogenase [Sphingomonadales bacterium]
MIRAAQRLCLVERLPAVRGEYVEAVPLSDFTWLRVGGAAEVVFRPSDEVDLIDFLKRRPRDIPVTVIGVGSNILVRDGGIPGVVIRLGRAFSQIEIDGVNVRVGAGAPDVGVAMACAASGVSGLEFLRGIPGTIGGALRMNAGAYGSEVRDVLVQAMAIDPTGRVHVLNPDDFGFSYRHCTVPEDWIFTGAVLRGAAGDPNEISKRMKEIADSRLGSQPVRSRTGGSTFKNPAAEVSGGLKAWQLIDAAGCRGLRHGGAQMSEHHCNFLINTGDATASDLETLGEEVRRRVLAATGVALQWEVRIIGLGNDPASQSQRQAPGDGK